MRHRGKLFCNFSRYHRDLFVIRQYIWHSSEICGSYSPTFAMKIAHNATLTNFVVKVYKAVSYKIYGIWTRNYKNVLHQYSFEH